MVNFNLFYTKSIFNFYLENEQITKENFKSTIEEEINRMYHQGVEENKARKHKRIVSMKQPEFSSHSLALHAHRHSVAEGSERNAAIALKKRHAKCKAEHVETIIHRK